MQMVTWWLFEQNHGSDFDFDQAKSHLAGINAQQCLGKGIHAALTVYHALDMLWTDKAVCNPNR